MASAIGRPGIARTHAPIAPRVRVTPVLAPSGSGLGARAVVSGGNTTAVDFGPGAAAAGGR